MKKALKSLIYGKHGGLSVGRIMLWVTFGILCYFWVRTAYFCQTMEAPVSLQDAFMFLLIYEFGKKGRDVAGDYFLKKPVEKTEQKQGE